MNSNTGLCKDPPYVYDSSSNSNSDFEYVGDDKSNCTLLIHNVQFRYSGEYRFRFITNVDRGTGFPGVTVQVADLKVSLIRLSGDGTLKQGDSLNLMCDVTCTHSSSQFVWSKNNEQLNTSGPVLHFPALTVRDSGNYTCTWKTNKASGSKTISLQVEGDWSVKYPGPVCAVRGFSVSIPCSYYYPKGLQVTQMLWCSMNSNTGTCHDPPYVYSSSSNTKSDFEYVGDDKSNCTLLIHNVQFSYSGEYRFRFITDWIDGEWTGEPGVTLQVAGFSCVIIIDPSLSDLSDVESFLLSVKDLKVSLIRLSGNGTLKQGDSLNLMCDVNCTHSSSQFVWSKNNKQLNTSGPVLHFPALAVRDSGNYICTWKTNEASGSKTISLQVEGYNPDLDHWSVWMILGVTAGVSVLVSVFLGAVIYSRRTKAAQM
ncbi:myeloid cell surface antigen CD33-like isoform X1 [Clarias magur]|uniref:Myeloid cell surface antigen CD33-like isoform X1 n=1 Tax=Clarias magur TaxID=1594786 RepID=A0A8J4TWX1_CLAMG|nr:myeloid cell surface antigen CD33-like isoform X1 [Clarias magur]